MDPAGDLSPLLLFTALGAGVVSFLSPCILPLVPAYVGLITRQSAEELSVSTGAARTSAVTHALAFVFGLAFVFALLGASATTLGQALGENLALLIRLSGLLVIAMGLNMMGVLRLPVLYRTMRLPDSVGQRQNGYIAALLMGAAFGAGWTPCVGPFLAGILGLAATESTVAEGTLLLLAYALGLGVPFVAAALAIDRTMAVTRRIRPHLPTIERVSGAIVVVMGLLLLSERMTLVTAWILRVFGPGLAQ